jgi:hypothetical protein
MNRSALKSSIQLTLIAVSVVLFWLFGFSDPCLGTEISNHFTAHDPPVIVPVGACVAMLGAWLSQVFVRRA